MEPITPSEMGQGIRQQSHRARGSPIWKLRKSKFRLTLDSNPPPTSAGLHALRDEYTRTIEPARALAAETVALERTLSDLVNQAYALTPAEIALMWEITPPRMPIPPRGK